MNEKHKHLERICPMCLAHGTYAKCLEEECMWYVFVENDAHITTACAIAIAPLPVPAKTTQVFAPSSCSDNWYRV